MLQRDDSGEDGVVIADKVGDLVAGGALEMEVAKLEEVQVNLQKDKPAAREMAQALDI